MPPFDVGPIPRSLETTKERMRVFRNLEVDVDVASALADARACQEVAEILSLGMGAIQDGADLRPQTYLIAQHPTIRRWLEISDAMTERSVYAGPIELVVKRRKGILRQLKGADQGLPLEGPGILLLKPGQEGHYGILEDELEYHPLRVFATTQVRPYRVPEKSLLNSKDVRSLLGWTWYRFERYFRTHTQEPTGRRLVHGSREYAFDAADFAAYVHKNSL